MLKNIIEHCDRAKFVPELKKVIVELAEAIDARLDRLEAVVLEHAKLLDPKAFNEDPPTPAEAVTDAPTEITETAENITETSENITDAAAELTTDGTDSTDETNAAAEETKPPEGETPAAKPKKKKAPPPPNPES
jgi:hypothetical protein